jgi:hypothetical protein
MHRLIDEAAEIDTMRVVVFTGGECFLLGKDLDALVSHATEKDLLTRFVSNGYWGATRAVALRRIEKLKSAGLKEANFSTGDNHQKFVNPRSVRYGAMACADHGIPVSVMVEMFSETAFDLTQFVEEDPEFAKYVSDGRVVLKPSFWMRFQGKQRISYPESAVAEFAAMEKSCETIFNVVAVTPEQKLMACCGLPQEQIEELHLGDLRKSTIKDILNRTPDDLIKIWIHVDGPGAIIRYANQFDSSIGFPDNMGHICEVCRWMYQQEKLKEVVRANPPPEIEEILAAYSSRMLLQFAGQKARRGELDERIWDENRKTMTLDAVKELWNKVVPQKSIART